MDIIVRKYTKEDIPRMIEIWNEIVEEGSAFPQEELLTQKTGEEFFAEQSYCGVACDNSNKEILGLYILHPNNVGRCSHICNASYGVHNRYRGKHIGKFLVKDCIAVGKEMGFSVLQFNAVVKTN